jgi:hypothetical protein
VKVNRAFARLALVAVAGCLVPALTATASGADTPAPWEPTSAALGTLTFYDSSGNAVTGGSDVSHLFDYAVASTSDPSTKVGTLANIEFVNPTPNEDPGLWPATLDESSPTPNAGAPNSIDSSGNPIESEDSIGANLYAAEGGFTPNTQADYVNVFQIRLYTSGPGGAGTTSNHYWDADVEVSDNTSAATWHEIYPVQGGLPTATTTTINVSPETSATQGQSVTITATETADDNTHPAGTMEIDDGSQVLTPDGGTTVDSNGSAAVTLSTLLPGTHSFTATFTDTAAGYSGSTTASPTSYLVNPVAAKPTITGTARAGDKVTCHEATTSGETVSFEWLAGTTKAGSGASLTIPGSAVGKTLTCRATVKVAGGAPSSATSAGKKVALGAPLKAVTKPKLSGSGKVGATEKVSSGRWSPSASSYHYQWLLNGKAITGATKSSFTIVKKDKGKRLSCRVTARKTGFAPGSATSNAVTVTK